MSSTPAENPRIFRDSAIVVAWIVFVAMVGLKLGFKELWAPFFCAIMFSIANKDKAKIPEIILGAVSGVWLAWGIVLLIGCSTPFLGAFWATAVVLFFGVYIVFCGGVFVPLLINKSTFVYLTVALATHISEPPVEATSLILVGGTLLLIGEVAILAVLRRPTASFSRQKLE